MEGAVVDEDGNPHVAVKELTIAKSLNWDIVDKRSQVVENEASVLPHLGRQEHPHLIKTIARYTQGTRQFFIFPWAKGGNLRNFWKEQPSLSTAYKSLNLSQGQCVKYIRWFFKQLVGLSGGIEKLHNTSNQPGGSRLHGNLKPENILCFCSVVSGAGKLPTNITLVIADAGHAKNREAMNLSGEWTTTQLGTHAYLPPEREVQGDNAISRRNDIWSIGCLYLEFLIWILYGNGGLEAFHDDVKRAQPYTFYMTNPDICLKPEVRFWIEEIKKDPRCAPIMSTAVGRLIDLIENRLLVVDTGVLSRPSSAIGEATLTLSELVENFDRAPTVDSNQKRFTERANASEMLEEMKRILEATLASGPRSLKCINWDGMAQAEQRGIPTPGMTLDNLPRPLSTTGPTTVDDMWSEKMKSQDGSVTTGLSSKQDEELADNVTVYDMVPSASLLTKTRYITHFVDQLFRKVTRGDSTVYSVTTPAHMMSADDLTELFKCFSLKIGYDSDHLHRKIMAFAYQNSRCVHRCILNSYSDYSIAKSVPNNVFVYLK